MIRALQPFDLCRSLSLSLSVNLAVAGSSHARPLGDGSEEKGVNEVEKTEPISR